jgi:hypothetical protein
MNLQKIKLGSKVVVSDPCYTDPDIVINDVLSGNYVPFIRHMLLDDWGKRIGAVACIHESFLNEELTWEEADSFGVDSGQAGIFDFHAYQNDESVAGLTPYDFKGGDPNAEEFFYRVCCNLTMHDSGWGLIDQGVVSSTGFGDGFYDLYVARHAGRVVGIYLDYRLEEDADFHFYLSKK